MYVYEKLPKKLTSLAFKALIEIKFMYKRPPKLSQDEVFYMLELFYEQHVKIDTLELIFPVSKPVIYSVLQGRSYRVAGFDYSRYPWNSPPVNLKVTREILSKMQAMRTAGATYKVIAEAFGISQMTAHNWLTNSKPKSQPMT